MSRGFSMRRIVCFLTSCCCYCHYVYISEACIRKTGLPLSEDLSPEGYYIPRSRYQSRSVYEPEVWKEQFLLPKEEQPRLTEYQNGDKILETCHTTSIFPMTSCSGECPSGYLTHFTKHTGQDCRSHTCRMVSHCEGVRCLCCQKVTCYLQPNNLEEVLEIKDVEDGVRLVDNCSLDSFNQPCQVSFHRRSAPEGDRCDPSEEARQRVQIFLNATCSRPLSCKSYRRCSGLTCKCCQRLTCVTVPHVADRNLDFPKLHSQDQNLLDLHRLRNRKASLVTNDDYQRKRYHYFYSENGRYMAAAAIERRSEKFLNCCACLLISCLAIKFIQ